MKTFSIRISSKMEQELQKLALEREQNIAQLIRYAIKKYYNLKD